jgi:succinyl-CoA synthetase beta subunit
MSADKYRGSGAAMSMIDLLHTLYKLGIKSANFWTIGSGNAREFLFKRNKFDV